MATEHSSAAQSPGHRGRAAQPRRAGRCTRRSRTPTRRSPPRTSPAPSRRSTRCSATRATSRRAATDLSAAAVGRRQPGGGRRARRAQRRAARLHRLRRRGAGRVRDGLPADRRLVPPGRLRGGAPGAAARREHRLRPRRTPRSARRAARRPSWPTLIAALVLAIVTGIVLYRAQRWLTRRTNRMFSPGLVLASLLLVISAVWLAAGLPHRPLGPRPGHRARLGARAEPGPGVASACSRSGATRCSTSSRAAATPPSPTTSPPPARRSGRAPGSWLGAAAAAQQPGGHGRRPGGGGRAGGDRLVRGERQVYTLGTTANYAARADQRRRRRPRQPPPATTRSKADISQAIGADQGVFQSAASAGASALSPLAGVVIAASVLMALVLRVGCQPPARRIPLSSFCCPRTSRGEAAQLKARRKTS